MFGILNFGWISDVSVNDLVYILDVVHSAFCKLILLPLQVEAEKC